MNRKVRLGIEAILRAFYPNEIAEKLPWASNTGWLERGDRIIIGYNAWIKARDNANSNFYYHRVNFKGLTKLYKSNAKEFTDILNDRINEAIYGINVEWAKKNGAGVTVLGIEGIDKISQSGRGGTGIRD